MCLWLDKQLSEALHGKGRLVKLVQHRTHIATDALQGGALQHSIPSRRIFIWWCGECGEKVLPVLLMDFVLRYEQVPCGAARLGLLAQQRG